MNMKVWNMLTYKEKEQLWTRLTNEYYERKYINLKDIQSA